jgi:ribose-phosphate pyrophosphokinase
MTSRGALTLMACESGRPFAERVIEELSNLVQNNFYRSKFSLKETEEMWFANGEVKTVIKENIRGDDFYIIQAIDDPNSKRSVNDNLMALFSAVDAAYQSDADRITVVIPQFPYSRQERKKTREGITAKLIAKFLETVGADRVITLDIHAEAIQGFFTKTKMENLHASRTLIEHMKSNYSVDTMMVVCPDVGGAERARFFSKELKTDLAIVDKSRNYKKASTIEEMRLVGEVEGRDVLLVDDMIATGGTLVNACKLLKEKGASKIYCLASLPFLNGAAVEKIDVAVANGYIDKVVATDAVYRGKTFEEKFPWYDEVSIAPLFAKVIYNINMKLSVSELLR